MAIQGLEEPVSPLRPDARPRTSAKSRSRKRSSTPSTTSSSAGTRSTSWSTRPCAELDTTDLHIKADQLFARVGAAAETIDQLISRNARVSQDQSEYQRRFAKLTSEHAALLDEYHQLLAQISDLENRQAAYCYYKEQLAILDPASIEFTPYLWHTLVDHAEVGTDDTITFTFRDGAKQTQHIGK